MSRATSIQSLPDTSSPSGHPDDDSISNRSTNPSKISGPPSDDLPPFSVRSNTQKWTTVLLASLAAVFGPISSNIYVPSLPQIADQFNRSSQDINLTLTIYLVFQATAPSVLSGLSDSLGRRPILMICLSVYICACVGIALTPTSAYWLLMLLRAIQAIGGSPAIGTGAGIVGDLAAASERGKFMGLFQGVALLGPALGPVLGGILVQYMSWRWIFWILALWCGSTLIGIFFCMPETLRAIVGNGSVPPPKLNSRPIDIIRARKSTTDVELQEAYKSVPEKKEYKPFASLQMLVYPEVILILTFGSCAFACMFASITVLSSILTDDYGYNDVKVGLCYLPQGVGCMVIGMVGGRIHDWHFAKIKEKTKFLPKHPRDLDGFPIERCRFHYVPFYLPLFLGAVIGYGWTLYKGSNIAGPLILSAIIGMGAQFSTQICALLLVDMFPTNAGASSAAFNLIRCAMSAVVSAVVDPMMKGVGLGWTFTILAAVMLASYPGVIVVQRRGPGWRSKRNKEWGTAIPVRHTEDNASIPRTLTAERMSTTSSNKEP